MNEVRKLDSRRRGVFPDCFSPGDLFLEEEVGTDRVLFRRIKAAEPPLVRVKKVGGQLLVRAPVDRGKIRAAIREDRDSR